MRAVSTLIKVLGVLGQQGDEAQQAGALQLVAVRRAHVLSAEVQARRQPCLPLAGQRQQILRDARVVLVGVGGRQHAVATARERNPLVICDGRHVPASITIGDVGGAAAGAVGRQEAREGGGSEATLDMLRANRGLDAVDGALEAGQWISRARGTDGHCDSCGGCRRLRGLDRHRLARRHDLSDDRHVVEHVDREDEHAALRRRHGRSAALR